MAKPQFRLDAYPFPLSNTKHELTVDVGGTIADMIPEGRHVVAIVNNRILPLEEYATREPIEGDYVVLRAVPTGAVVGAIAAIGSALAAGAGAAGIGFLGLTGLSASLAWSALSIGITIIGGLIQRSLIEPPQQPDSLSREAGERKPGITGQSNRIDPFGVIDCHYGKTRVIPKLGGKPYTEIAGDDQYLRMLFVVGHGPLQFEKYDIR